MNVKIFSGHEDTYSGPSALSLAENGLPDDTRVIYRGRNTVGVTADGQYCVKAFGVPGKLKGLIYGLFKPSKARRAYRNACRLLELGINTPVPYVAVERKQGAFLKESYFVCDYLDGWTELRGIERRDDFDRLARALAAFMANLHRKGVMMKDFTQGNILFKPTADGYDFALIDINRMSFGVHSRRSQLRNFQSTLDTPQGMKTLAAEYAAITGASPSLVSRILYIYSRHQVALWRKRYIKACLRRSR